MSRSERLTKQKPSIISDFAIVKKLNNKKNNKVNFDNAENVEINFLLWVDKLPIEKLTKVPHDYNNSNVRYDQESIEVLEVTKI